MCDSCTSKWSTFHFAIAVFWVDYKQPTTKLLQRQDAKEALNNATSITIIPAVWKSWWQRHPLQVENFAGCIHSVQCSLSCGELCNYLVAGTSCVMNFTNVGSKWIHTIRVCSSACAFMQRSMATFLTCNSPFFFGVMTRGDTHGVWPYTRSPFSCISSSSSSTFLCTLKWILLVCCATGITVELICSFTSAFWCLPIPQNNDG